MPRPKKSANRARVAAPKSARPSGLVGRFYRYDDLLGQIVAAVTEEAYLAQPFAPDGTAAGGQKLYLIDRMADNGEPTSFTFYETVTELLATTGEPPAPPEKSAAVKTAPPAEKPAPAKTAPAEKPAPVKTETKKAPIDEVNPERALSTLSALVGEHGIVTVKPVKQGKNDCASIAVEVNGDPSEAKMAVPEVCFGVPVEIVPVKSESLANGKGKEEPPKEETLY